MGLAFNWGDALELNGDAVWQDVGLNGVVVRSQRLQMSGRLHTFGILFQPSGAFEAFGVPPAQLTDVGVVSDLGVTPPLADLHAQLFEAGDFRQRIALAETWLMRLLARSKSPSPLIAPSLGLLARSHGQLPIANLSDTLAVSPRQLERLFKTQVGLTPKQMARLYRVRLARGLLKQSATGSLADVAYRCGFYDQAHFIRDFRAVTGMTPGAYQVRHWARQAKKPPSESA